MDNQKLTKKQKRELARKTRRAVQEKEKKMKFLYKTVVWIVAIGIICFAGYRFFVWISTPVDNVIDQEILGDLSKDWVKGDPDAVVTLVEYGDFQCPACGAYFQVLKSIVEDDSQNIKIVYRHFPLSNIHTNAISAALASEASGLQGEFWGMHDKLFDNQDEWSDSRDPIDIFVDYANDLDLDVDKFRVDFESELVANLVNEDIDTGNRIGINSTPSFILNGEKVMLTRNIDDFVNKITSKISK